jgi:mannose-6-phosphate isomerase-like protein (cupin superfamily)
MLTQEYHVPMDAQLNMTLQHFQVPPRPAEPYFHWHHQLEISLVCFGSGVYWSEDREYEVGEGDIFIFNSTEPHASGVTSTTDLEHIVLSFVPDLIWSIENHVTDPRCLRIFLGHSESVDNRVPANLEAAQVIRGLIEEMAPGMQKQRCGIRVDGTVIASQYSCPINSALQ